MIRDEALEIVELHKHLEVAVSDDRLYSDMERVVRSYVKAKGFLEGFAEGENKGYEQGVRESAERCRVDFPGGIVQEEQNYKTAAMLKERILALLEKK